MFLPAGNSMGGAATARQSTRTADAHTEHTHTAILHGAERKGTGATHGRWLLLSAVTRADWPARPDSITVLRSFWCYAPRSDAVRAAIRAPTQTLLPPTKASLHHEPADAKAISPGHAPPCLPSRVRSPEFPALLTLRFPSHVWPSECIAG